MTSLSVGVSGLTVNQNAINTTSHNLANVDTNGYVRQQVLIKDVYYTTIGQSAHSLMQVGLGAATETVRQVRNSFLDQQIRREVGRLGFYDSQLEAVYEVEDIFGETQGERFQVSMQDIWNSLQELIKTPSDRTARTNFVKKAEAFLERAQTMSNQINTYQININQQIVDKVDRINQLGQSIYELNEKIRKNESSGLENANDYRDTRNSCLDELAQLVNITYKEDANGVVTVMAEGVAFVTEDLVTKMGIETVTPNYEKVSELSKLIADYNTQIQAAPAAQQPALMAQRQQYVDELKKYIVFTEDETGGNGTLKITTDFGDLVDGVKSDAYVAKQMCSTSPMVKPVWPSLNTDVFNFDRLPSGENNTNIGSLKGLVLVRGTHQANYTDIPKREDYASDKAYDNAVQDYNIMIDSSMIMKIQSEFDQLIHGIVTGINDILCPNVEIELADGTKIVVFDEANAPAGIDGDPSAGEAPTKGEALFNRKGIDRYQAAEVVTTFTLDSSGNKIVDPSDPSGTGFKTETRTVYRYNEEDPLVDYSLFTLGELEINKEILQDYSKLPLNSGDGTGEESRSVAEQLDDLWDTKFSSLNPNSLAGSTFKDYYIAMTGEFANRGNTIQGLADYQLTLVNEIETKRLNVTGVSSDEELTNLIRFQHAYNASSRYINVISEMLEHIVTRL